MICASGKIKNPKTGRCVKRDGKIGREILGKSPPPRRKRRSIRRAKCSDIQILNPKTGRCVKRDGKIGREILGKSPLRRKRKGPIRKTKLKSRKRRTKLKSRKRRTKLKSRKRRTKLKSKIIPVKPVGLPIKFKKIAEDCNELDKWEKGKFLGSGSYGAVYSVCRAGNCDYVLKTQKNDADFQYEVKALSALNNWKYSPKIYAAWSCKDIGYLIEEKVVVCDLPKSGIYKQLKTILAQLHKKRWVFVDIHQGNVMCTQGGKKVLLIDFGWARHLSPGQTIKQGSHEVADALGRPVNLNELIMAETANLEGEFGVYGSKTYNEAMMKWNNVY